MACFHPITGYRSRELSPSGKRRVVFSSSDGYKDLVVTLPCGQCVGCRLERSRQWAVRCMHEASLHSDNCFITLTYNNKNLPSDGSLHVDHYQKFMKRLRKKFGSKIRFFHCGEYGEKFRRPHYHACIFGFDFPDKVLFSSPNGQKLYTSEILAKLWPFGFSTIGTVTFESAAYCARYIMKKITGDAADEHYNSYDTETGEVVRLKPEYTTMSRRPGIASDWFKLYGKDVFPSDQVIVNGKPVKPPKFYDSQFEIEDPDGMADIKRKRALAAARRAEDNSDERLLVKEKVKLSKLKLLKRTVDEVN